MSHFSLAVVIDRDSFDNAHKECNGYSNKENRIILEELVDKALEPFDEGKWVPDYVAKTAEELEIEYKQLLEKIDKGESNVSKHDVITIWDYAEYRYGKVLDINDGNLYSNYNPNSKWDWYQIGGRWSDVVPGHVVQVQDIDEAIDENIYAVLDKNGKWHEPGEMLHFGMTSATEEQLKAFSAYNIIKETSNEEDLIVVVDCHI